jgi:membrane-associated phospholipid phosphatase
MNYKLSYYFKKLELGDLITIVFLNFLSLVCLVFFNKIEVWWALILLNSLISVFILSLASHSQHRHGPIKIVRDWYWYPFILVIFKEIYAIIQSLHLPDYDQILINIDRWIFGLDPTVWCYKFSNNFLTEFLQICYSSFYFILFGVPLWYYFKKQYKEFYYSYFLILFGFYVSYIGYLLVPAIGPRFTIHDIALTDQELPGLFLTESLRKIINMGESIPANFVNAIAMVQRDCFPSGHTEMTLISIYLSFKFNQKIKWVVFIVGTGLIIGTVYLRYHYVIDVLAGSLCAIMVIAVSPFIQKYWERKRIL